MNGGASKQSNRHIQRYLAAFYALLLAVASLLPGKNLPKIPDWSRLFSPDKVAHFGAYGLFALLLSVCFSERRNLTTTAKAVILASAFGASMEVLQAVAGTGRSFDFIDMVANCLGAVLGGLVFFVFQRTK